LKRVEITIHTSLEENCKPI